MAEIGITPNRVHFASAGAGRRPLASQPFPITVAAHYKLVAALVAEGAVDRIIGNADRIDLNDHAEHLKKVLAAMTAYAKAIVTDTCCSATCQIHDETDGLCDAAADVIA